MPAVDNGALRSAIDQTTQNGGIAFNTTHWNVVLAAQGESPAAREALEKLCRTYWWPVYGFIRRQGYKPEEAQDLAMQIGLTALVTILVGALTLVVGQIIIRAYNTMERGQHCVTITEDVPSAAPPWLAAT